MVTGMQLHLQHVLHSPFDMCASISCHTQNETRLSSMMLGKERCMSEIPEIRPLKQAQLRATHIVVQNIHQNRISGKWGYNVKVWMYK